MEPVGNLGILGHELRTPLNSILGFTRLLADDDRLPEDCRRKLRIVHDCSTYLLGLLEGLISVSRLADGAPPARPAPLDVWELATAILSSQEPSAAGKGLGLELVVTGTLPAVLVGDRLLLRQILTNLVTNAVRYTAEGGVRVELACPQGPDPCRLTVLVGDTGRGMAVDQVAAAFNVAGAILPDDPSATGLGLWLSQRLARVLGGELQVASRPGLGSLFRLAVPMTVPPGTAWLGADELRRRRPVEIGGDGGFAGCRALVVDDDPASQLLLSSLLKRHRLQVVLAGDGQTAVDLVRDEARRDFPFDLVFLDLRLPRLDGCAVLAILRRGGYQGRVCAVTADAVATEEADFMARGFDALLVKPIDPDALARFLGSSPPRPAVGG
jgi:CheY-like chemotaxis protein